MLVALLCASVCVSSAGDAKNTPRFLPGSISFWDANRGAATLGACDQSVCVGEVATTEDGGRTWTVRWHGSSVGRVTVVPGTREAWLEGQRGLLRSRDKGRTWTRVPHTVGLRGPSFPVAHIGFAVRSRETEVGTLLRTDNGARTWKRITLPCERVLKRSAILSFASPDHGWLMCNGQPGTGQQEKALYETLDRGGHWRRLLRTGVQRAGGLYGSGYAAGMSFFPSGRGLLWQARENTFRTVDGGRHWSPLAITSPESREGVSASFVSERVAYLLLQNNGTRFDIELMRSTDGGRTWHRVRSWSRR